MSGKTRVRLARAASLLVLLPGLFLALTSCAQDVPAQDEEVPIERHVLADPSEPLGTALVLTHGTEFKLAILDEIGPELPAMGLSAQVDDLANHAQYDAGDFDIVVLLSGVQAFHPRPEAPAFIKANDYAENIVFFSTYTATNWPYGLRLNRNKIDAVTAASNVEDPSAAAAAGEQILARVAGIVDKESP